MSLAQHVTQAEGFDSNNLGTGTRTLGSENGETASTYQHRISNRPDWQHKSFAPGDTAYFEPHIAAYKIPVTTRTAQVATGIIACSLTSGIVFGFAALKPIMVAEGVYSELCDTNQVSRSHNSNEYVVPCEEQDLRLNLFFVIASVTANISSLLAGSALDKYGRRTCWLLACTSLILGCLLMGASFTVATLNGHMVANVLISLGGTFIFVPSFQLANSFPKYSGTIVAMITGAFDASAAVFLLYRVLYEATNRCFSIQLFFFIYAIVPAMIVIAEFAYMPRRSYHTTPELESKIQAAHDDTADLHDSDREIHDARELMRTRSARADRRLAKLDQMENVAGDTEHRVERRRVHEERQSTSGVWGIMHGIALRKQLLSPWFLLMLALTALQMLRMNYFIATIRAQYRYMLGSDKLSADINRFFDIALPVGGIASTPLIGILLNNHSVQVIFAFLTFMIIVVGVLNCLPKLWAGYATVVAFVLFRPLYYSAISDYATKVFGFAAFGRIYGTLVCISGVISLCQSALDAITHEKLHGDPTPINIGFAAAGAFVGVALTLFVAFAGRMFRTRKQMKHREDSERDPLLTTL